MSWRNSGLAVDQKWRWFVSTMGAFKSPVGAGTSFVSMERRTDRPGSSQSIRKGLSGTAGCRLFMGVFVSLLAFVATPGLAQQCGDDPCCLIDPETGICAWMCTDSGPGDPPLPASDVCADGFCPWLWAQLGGNSGGGSLCGALDPGDPLQRCDIIKMVCIWAEMCPQATPQQTCDEAISNFLSLFDICGPFWEDGPYIEDWECLWDCLDCAGDDCEDQAFDDCLAQTTPTCGPAPLDCEDIKKYVEDVTRCLVVQEGCTPTEDQLFEIMCDYLSSCAGDPGIYDAEEIAQCADEVLGVDYIDSRKLARLLDCANVSLECDPEITCKGGDPCAMGGGSCTTLREWVTQTMRCMVENGCAETYDEIMDAEVLQLICIGFNTMRDNGCGLPCNQLPSCVFSILGRAMTVAEAVQLYECTGCLDEWCPVGGGCIYPLIDVGAAGIPCDLNGGGAITGYDIEIYVKLNEKCAQRRGCSIGHAERFDLVLHYLTRCNFSEVGCANLIGHVERALGRHLSAAEISDIYLFSGCDPDDVEDPTRPNLPESEGDVDDDCGEDLNTWGGSPVFLATGHKVERVTDLVVPYSGGQLEVYREYSSTQEYEGHMTLLGERWVMSLFRKVYVEPGADDVLYVTGTPGDTQVKFTYDSSIQRWTAGGPTSQTIQKLVVTDVMGIVGNDYPIYRLHEPGAWTQDFIREEEVGEPTSETWEEGLLLQEFDPHGNSRYYTYYEFGTAPNSSGRLVQLFINGTSIDPDDANRAEAWLSFAWLDDRNGETDKWGRLGQITVNRHDANGDPIVTQRAEYMYVVTPGPYSGDIGTAGDLAQVAIYTQMNDAQEYWPQITQYRYHHGRTIPPTGDPRLDVTGAAHQLKMILQPEQIEYIAQKRGSGDPVDALEATAGWLLGRNDATAVFDEGGQTYRIVDAAAKVVGYDVIDLDGDGVPDNDPPVIEQYIQSACGGCGTTAQGLKQTYAYTEPYTGFDYSHEVGRDPAPGVSTRIQEFRSTGVGGVYEIDPYRTMYYDHARLGGTLTPYLINTVTVESDGTSQGDRYWIEHREYDEDNRNRIADYTASCYENDPTDPDPVYEAAIFGPSPVAPSLDQPNTTDGLVYLYEYTTDDNRRKKWSVNETSNTVPASTITTREILHRTDVNPLTGMDRRYLPQSIKLYTDDAGTLSEETTFEYQFHTTDVNAVMVRKVSVEAETEAQNGPTGSNLYERYSLFDEQGRLFWQRAEDNALTRLEYDQPTGKVSRRTSNADPTDLPPSPYEGQDLTGWGRFADGGSLATVIDVDELGRVVKATTPGGVERYVVRQLSVNDERPGLVYMTTITLPHELSPGVWNGPAVVQVYNASGQVIVTSEWALDPTAAYDPENLDFTLLPGGELSRTAFDHTLTGLITSDRVYHDIAGSDFYQTTYTYDALGRLEDTTDATGTISRNAAYDVLDRAQEVWLGTSTLNLDLAREVFYDHKGTAPNFESGVGNGNVTITREKEDDVTSRVTESIYDGRDRLQKVIPPLPPYSFFVYDEQNRVIKSGIFEQIPTDIDSPDRTQYTETSYSERGFIYKTARAIDPSNLTLGFLETHKWFGPAGRVVAEWAPTGPGAKRSFDGLGRTKTSYTTDRGGDAAPGTTGNYASAVQADGVTADVTGDIVFEQTNYTFDERTSTADWAGKVLLTESLYRFHDYDGAAPTGDLFREPPLDPVAVSTYSAYFYDEADRLTHTVEFGVNRDPASDDDVFQTNTAPTWPPLPQVAPDRDAAPYAATALVNETTFNIRGLTDTAIDPEGHAAKYFYDDLSRVIASAENYVDAAVGAIDVGSGIRDVTGAGGGTDNDEDRVTSFVYDGISNIVKQALHVSDVESAAQVTDYTYGVTESDLVDPSKLNANSLLHSVKYPDSAGDPDIVTFGYNRLGEMISTTDQNGTTHGYTYDALGRTTRDDGTPGATSDIDGAVRAIVTTYDDSGRVDKVNSRDLGDLIVNEIQFGYTPLWQVNQIQQDVDGALGAGGIASQTVAYSYENAAIAAGNHSRVSQLTYPGGMVVDYDYGSGTPDSTISRLRSITAPDYPTLDVATYDYVGIGMMPVVDLEIADVQLDRTLEHNGVRWGTGTPTEGRYSGWDRFGRTARQVWADGALTENATYGTVPNVPPIVEETYSYDRDSNRLTRTDARPGTHLTNRDFRFTHDKLDRLTQSERGAQGGTWSAAAGGQAWDLDLLGNWDRLGIDSDNDGDFFGTGEVEDRVHNDANEIESVTFPGGTPESPVHDDAGNLRDLPRPTGGKDSYTYDSWNRLVKVEFNESGSPVTLGEYAYDGLNRRILAKSDTDLDGDLDEDRYYYFSDSWRILEEHIDGFESSEAPDGVIDRVAVQIYGINGLNNALMRRIDSDPAAANGFEANFYLLCDVLGSCVAVIDENHRLYERVVYDPYGKAVHRWAGDTDGDGDVDFSDTKIPQISGPGGDPILPDIGTIAYRVDADLNRDGTFDTTDLIAVFQWTVVGATPLGDGLISSREGPADQTVGPDCRVGYTGHTFMPEGLIYDMRNRDYSPRAGRFLQRDPIGYVDGMSLYEYVRSGPLGAIDWFGLDDDRNVGYTWIGNRKGYRVSLTETKNGARVIADTKFYEYGTLMPNGLTPGEMSRLENWSGNNWQDLQQIADLRATYDDLLNNAQRELNDGYSETYSASAMLTGGVGLGCGINALRRGKGLRDVWSDPPFQRGRKLEQARGANTGYNFPKVDRWNRRSGTVTSIKSLDPSAKTYQNFGKFTSKMRGYVDDVASFNGAQWGGVRIRAGEIRSKQLELIVPKGGLGKDQKKWVQAVTNYGKSKGVRVKVIKKGRL